MKVNIKNSDSKKGIFKKTTVYRAEVMIELEPEEQAVIDRHPELLDEIVHFAMNDGGPEIKQNFGRFLKQHCLIFACEDKSIVNNSINTFKENISNFKQTILSFSDDSPEETFDV